MKMMILTWNQTWSGHHHYMITATEQVLQKVVKKEER